jgi:hypothetical protein
MIFFSGEKWDIVFTHPGPLCIDLVHMRIVASRFFEGKYADSPIHSAQTQRFPGNSIKKGL